MDDPQQPAAAHPAAARRATAQHAAAWPAASRDAATQAAAPQDAAAQPAAAARSNAFSRLFEAVHEGVYIGLLGPRVNLTLATNPYLRLIFGYPADTPDASLRPFAADRFTDEGARQVFLDRLAREGSVTAYLLRLRRTDGTPIWVEVTAHAEVAEAGDGARPATAGATRPESGDPVKTNAARAEPARAEPAGPARAGAVPHEAAHFTHADPARAGAARVEAAGDGTLRLDALVRDVSDRKKLEDQSRDLYHQLLQAEKMAALGTTISGVAHELNNPLATILAIAERIAERDLDPDSRRGLDSILHEAERAARIVRNLLTFARKRHSTRTMVDVNQVVRETLSLRAYEQRVTNITVIDALAAGIPQIFADAHQIQQVLLNLVINAEQAMLTANGRGTVVVRTWQDAEHESIVLEVNDDGPGVPEEVRLKIFDPFFTTKAVGKGTGLGLTVAYAIVEEHGGRMWLESEPGRGASFFIELPAGGKLKAGGPPVAATGAGRARAEAGAAGPARVAAARPALAAETGGVPGAAFGQTAARARLDSAAVLIVEDEAALASAIAESFTDAGFLVDRAVDGEDALAHLESGRYDLIVSDLKMPRMDGIRMFAELRRSYPGMTSRVVFVTGDVIGTDAERFLAESGCRWLAKPFRMKDLLRMAGEVIDVGG